MNRLIRLIFLVYIALFSSMLMAQDRVIHKNHSLSLNIQFIQIKDEFNYGLVFSGVNLGVRYSFVKTSDRYTLSCAPDLAFGPNFKKGIGIAILFRPINLFYGFNVTKSNVKPLTIGPYLATNYQWQAYPELQSGHMFWFTSLEAGPRLLLMMPFKGKLFKITLSNSIAGWTSRPEPATETTFYSIKFSDFFRNAHSNLQFGSYNLFNHTNFEIELVNTKGKKLSVAYEFEYFGYYQEPRYQCLLNTLNLKWKIGKIKQGAK
jgi:hypothetical protein